MMELPSLFWTQYVFDSNSYIVRDQIPNTAILVLKSDIILANRQDHDKMSHSVAFFRGIRCLQMCHVRTSIQHWV